MAHQDRFAVANAQQLRWEGAVKRPQGLRVLDRHVRVEANADTAGGAVKPGRAERVADIAFRMAVAAVRIQLRRIRRRPPAEKLAGFRSGW